MGNFSRSPQTELASALQKGYFSVRFQQGKPALDRDLNLAADLANPRQLAANYIGNGVPPIADGFRISNLQVATSDFTIGAGRCLVNGLEALGPINTSYRAQPLTTSVAPLPAGPSNVYLRVSLKEVTGADDAALSNPADVTFETAVREQVVWEVIVSVAPIAAADHYLLAVIDTTTVQIEDRRLVGLSLAGLRSEISAARGSAVSLGPRLNTSLAQDGSILAGAVSMLQIKKAGTFAATLAINPPNAEASMVFFRGARQANMLVSLMITAGIGAVSWREFTIAATSPAGPVFSRGVVVRNETLPLAAITVAIQAVEIAQT